MCKFVEHPADRYFGRILSLQDHRDEGLRFEHLIDELFGTSTDTNTIQGRLSFNIARAFRSRAHTAVVENYYFDLDFRSELGRLQEDTFLPMPADVSRVHFFANRARGTKIRLRDFVASADKKDYLGYVVVRPLQVGTFGRSIITTQTSIAPDVGADVAEHRIKTAVSEPVQLFGIDLDAVGVPFMEQDGRLLRCAHVSAWICHYSGVLRGDVTRRPSGHFHSSDLAIESVGRPFPSQGLSVPMLSALLRTMDLPPEVIDETELLRGRRKKNDKYVWNWSDGPAIRLSVEAAVAANDKKALNRIWVRHNLTTTVARYVNSSTPVILARVASEHTQVIVGYLRASDYPSGATAQDKNSPNNPIVAFIVSDDSAGPFQLVQVDLLVEQVMEHIQGIFLVIPLPRSLWMGGSTAELLGINWLDYYVEDRLVNWPGDKASLADFADLLAKDKLAVRTYMTTGTDFKRTIADHMKDAETIRGATQIQLPRYVWVVEVFKRTESAPLDEAMAMVVFDPTGPANRNEGADIDESAPPLFAYLPGMTYADYDAIGDLWFETSVETFPSGRSGHKPGDGRSREGWKAAVAGVGSR